MGKNGLKLIFILLFMFMVKGAHSQEQKTRFKYNRNPFVIIVNMDSLYQSDNYRASIDYNLSDLDSSGKLKRFACYRLAQNYSLLRIEDSAFYYLNNYIDENNPTDYRSVYVEQDFECLRNNKKEWKKVIDRIENLYLEELDSNMNKDISLKLFRMGINDQKYLAYRIISNRRGKAVTPIEIINIERKNKKQLKKIIRKYGIPTPSMVGLTACEDAFFVLQHSIIEDKYYYMVQEAYERGDYPAQYYALLTDRWRIQSDEKQLYGTQFSNIRDENGKIKDVVLCPVEDFKNLNERRRKIRLGTIEEYALHMKGRIPEEYYKE